MKTILEKAKKWFASVHSEVPAFCKLCKVTIFLITKTIKKKDTSVDKSAFAELRTKTPNAQIAFGGIVVAILLVLLMRGCGDPRKDALTRLSTFETKARVLRGLSYAFLNYQIKVFTTPLRMPFAPLPS